MLNLSCKITANGLRLGAGGDFYHKTCYEAESSNLRKTVIRSTKPPLVPNRCYGLPFFCRISPIPNVKSPKVSIAIPTYKMKISPVGSVICLPIAAAKKPKLIVMAEIGNESRANHFQRLDKEAWSAKS